MTRKILTIIIALLLPAVVSVAQNAESTTDGTTGATAQHREAISADEANDTTVVSFLTCSPGDQIHRLYGHTALRLQYGQEDWAVNFGWFSFNTPNFVMKFILGLTDYSMAYQTMPIFIMDLMRDDMGITEQVLNLTPEEADYVKKAMRNVLESEGYETHDYAFSNPTTGVPKKETVLGAHWTYRYNFLYDNCTTRAVDAIKEAVKACGEELVYPSIVEHGKTTTQRTMIHEFTTKSPWYEFGQDLLLGPEVDETHTIKALVDSVNFLPTYAENFFENAKIKGKDGSVRPLVSKTQSLTPFLVPQERHPAVPFTPMILFGALCGVAIIITMFERKANLAAQRIGAPTASQRAWRIWGNAFDFTMWTLLGIVGILLVIMVGWSEHPAVGTNWLLLIFNPLFFLGIPARLVGGKFESIFVWFATIMAIATMLVDICGLQDLPYALIPIVITVTTRAKLK
ncbi:MAG: DUF4105 domain-containing protein [Bacteroidales bacterium]|nr:DUF4105 domain-containing protein [Bacteroidales bacterium]